jgi:hypothetical protein
MELEDRPSTPPQPSRRYDKLYLVMEAQGERPILVVEYKAAHKLCPALLEDFEPIGCVDVDRIIYRHKIAT